MILGMSMGTFTAVHVVISLIGIAAGGIVVVGMLSARRLPGWTALFLGATVLTSVTALPQRPQTASVAPSGVTARPPGMCLSLTSAMRIVSRLNR